MFLFSMSLVVSLWGTKNHIIHTLLMLDRMLFLSCTEQNSMKYTHTVCTRKKLHQHAGHTAVRVSDLDPLLKQWKFIFAGLKESVVDELQTLTLMRQYSIQHWLDVGNCFVQVFSNVGSQIVAVSTEKSHTSIVHNRLKVRGQTAGRSTQNIIDLLTWNNWNEGCQKDMESVMQ